MPRIEKDKNKLGLPLVKGGEGGFEKRDEKYQKNKK